MNFFKTYTCANCKGSADYSGSIQLSDRSVLCPKCAAPIAPMLYKAAKTEWELEDYTSYLEYCAQESARLVPVFCRTHTYKNMHIDATHGLMILFCGNNIFDQWGKLVTNNVLILDFKYISYADVIFINERQKEGIFGLQVSGDVLFEYVSFYPFSFVSSLIDTNVKAIVKKQMFSNHYTYYTPDEILRFASVLKDCVNTFYT